MMVQTTTVITPVSLWFALGGQDLPFRPSVTAGAGASAGPRDPERLQTFTRPLVGEFHLLALP